MSNTTQSHSCTSHIGKVLYSRPVCCVRFVIDELQIDMKSTNPIYFCSQPENSISNNILVSPSIFLLIWWLEHYTCMLSRFTFCVSSGTCIPYPKINALNKLKTGFIFYSNTRTHNCKSTLKQIWSLTKRPSPYNLNGFLFSERFRAIKFHFLHCYLCPISCSSLSHKWRQIRPCIFYRSIGHFSEWQHSLVYRQIQAWRYTKCKTPWVCSNGPIHIVLRC